MTLLGAIQSYRGQSKCIKYFKDSMQCANKDGSTASMPPKQWFCNCEKHCKGRTKEVSRSTYQRHAPLRNPAFLDGSGSGRCPPITHYFAPARPKRAEPGLADPHRTNSGLGARTAQVATMSRVSTPVRNRYHDLIHNRWTHRIVVGAGNHWHGSRQHRE
jgi:hypothetical protein